MRMRLLFAALLSVLPMPVLADTVYTYTGNPFNQGFNGSTFFPFPLAPFTASDSISGRFSVPNALGPNFCAGHVCQITPTAFSFTDGVDTFTNSTVMGNEMSPGSSFFVSTDSHGNIVDWAISLLIIDSPIAYSSLITAIDGMPPIDQGLVVTSYPSGEVFAFSRTAGTWTVTNESVVAPEPSTLLLLGSGVVGLAGGIRLRRVR